jgi:hypothetical protein
MAKADVFITADTIIYSYLKSIYEQPVILAIDDIIVNAADYDGISFKGVPEDKPGTRNHEVWNQVLEPYM